MPQRMYCHSLSKAVGQGQNHMRLAVSNSAKLPPTASLLCSQLLQSIATNTFTVAPVYVTISTFIQLSHVLWDPNPTLVMTLWHMAKVQRLWYSRPGSTTLTCNDHSCTAQGFATSYTPSTRGLFYKRKSAQALGISERHPVTLQIHCF